MAISHEAKKGVWIGRFLNKLLSKQSIRKIEMLNSNKTNLMFTRDLKSQNCTKHMNIMHHHVQVLVEDEKLKIE